MSDLRGQQLKDSYQNLVTDSGSNLSGIQNGNGVDITARIVERGSNSDGEFVRFADGTQIVSGDYSRSSETFSTATASGLFISSSGSAAAAFFPVEFIDTEYRVSVICSRPDHIAVGYFNIQKETDNFRPLFGRIDEGTEDISGAYIAEGRWK